MAHVIWHRTSTSAGARVTDPMAVRIVEIRGDADGVPLLLLDDVPVDLAAGDDPGTGRDGPGRRAGAAVRAPVTAVLVLDGGSTQWWVQVHPDGSVTDQLPAAPPVSGRRRRPAAWPAGAAALALLASGYGVVTTSSPSPAAPATSGGTAPPALAVPSTQAETARPTTVPTPTASTSTLMATSTRTPEPAPVPAAAPDPDAEPSRPRTARQRPAPNPRRTRPSGPTLRRRPLTRRRLGPTWRAVDHRGGPGSSSARRAGDRRRADEHRHRHRVVAARSQRPPTSEPTTATTGVSSSQRGQSGN